MKEFTIKYPTVEMTVSEAEFIKGAIFQYLYRVLPGKQLWKPEEEETVRKCFGMTVEQKNIEWRHEQTKMGSQIISVLNQVINGYPFKD